MRRSINSLTGYALKARDGEIGRCKDFLFDDQFWTIRYMVANTGTWLTGKKVLISPESIKRSDWKNGFFEIDLTMAEIEHAPLLDDDAPVSRQYEIRMARHYSTTAYWVGPYAWGSSEYPIGLPPQGVPDDIVINPDVDQDQNLRSASEITGYTISAADDEIGHVDDFILDDENWSIRYMVVDTRNWLPGRKVLISHLWIEFISWPERKVSVNLTGEQIENSPVYDPRAPVNREYEEQLYDYYGRPKYWK